MVENNDVNTSPLPWLIFTLGGNAFAVNSEYVNGIEMKSEKITPLPQAPDVYCGMVERRGEVYPILNMRRVFSFRTLDDENESFHSLVENTKDEMNEWFDGLMSRFSSGAAVSDTEIIGQDKLFRRFSDAGSAAEAKILKAQKSHKLLEEAMTEMLTASGDSKTSLMTRARDELSLLMKAFDEAVKAHRAAFRETVIVISDGSQMLGLLVDQVLAVDKIRSIVGSERMRVLMQSKYFEGVARNDRVDLEILVVNEEELMKLSEI